MEKEQFNDILSQLDGDLSPYAQVLEDSAGGQTYFQAAQLLFLLMLKRSNPVRYTHELARSVFLLPNRRYLFNMLQKFGDKPLQVVENQTDSQKSEQVDPASTQGSVAVESPVAVDASAPPFDILAEIAKCGSSVSSQTTDSEPVAAPSPAHVEASWIAPEKAEPPSGSSGQAVETEKQPTEKISLTPEIGKITAEPASAFPHLTLPPVPEPPAVNWRKTGRIATQDADYQGIAPDNDILELVDEPIQTPSLNQRKPPVAAADQPENLINRFLQNAPSMPRRAEPAPPGQEFTQEDMSEKSVSQPQEVATEVLAQIYYKQGYLDRAIEIYQKLCLKYPEKRAYFAGQIDKLTKG